MFATDTVPTFPDNFGFETSKAYKKSAKNCKNAAKNYLLNKVLSYNPSKEIWKYNKQTIDYEIVYMDLLQWSRMTNSFREHGLFVEEVLADVMTDPNFTGLSYIKSKIVRKRGNRISGKHLFSVYCRHTGIKIIGSIEEFTIKNNHIVKKFYDYLAKHFPNLSIIKRARIFGKLFSSVFIGIDLRTEDVVEPENSFVYTFESEKVLELSFRQTENLSTPPPI